MTDKTLVAACVPSYMERFVMETKYLEYVNWLVATLNREQAELLAREDEKWKITKATSTATTAATTSTSIGVNIKITCSSGVHEQDQQHNKKNDTHTQTKQVRRDREEDGQDQQYPSIKMEVVVE